MDRLDWTALTVFGGLAWEYDNPWILVIGGIVVGIVGPLSSWLGHVTGRKVHKALS